MSSTTEHVPLHYLTGSKILGDQEGDTSRILVLTSKNGDSHFFLVTKEMLQMMAAQFEKRAAQMAPAPE